MPIPKTKFYWNW